MRCYVFYYMIILWMAIADLWSLPCIEGGLIGPLLGSKFDIAECYVGENGE